jgi:hypothetical protein
MDPATTCCPTLACPARGQTGQGNIRRHSCTEKRFLCTECHKTCSATTGTACYRLRTSAEMGSLVGTLMAHGGPRPALVVACGSDERTGACGLARAGVQGQAVPEQRVEQPRDVGQGPADEIRVTSPGGLGWMARAMRRQTRWWLAGEVSEHRDLPRRRRLMERVRRCALHRPLWCWTDGVCSSLRAMRETLRAPGRPGAPGRPRLRPWRHLCLAPVVKRYAQRRVVDVARRSVEGTPARVETRRRRSHGAGVIHPADSARLNATCRERLASLTRRGRALARPTLTRHHGMSLRGTVYHCCPPQARLGLAAPGAGGRCLHRTAAMAAGITDHGWSVRALLSSHVPPPRWTPPQQRGRPSHALKRLIERWCRDHG